MWLTLRQTLRNERRITLERRLDRLDRLLRDNAHEPEADRIQDFHDFAHATGNGLAEVFSPGGARVFPSPSPQASAFPWLVPQAGEPVFEHVETGGQSYVVLMRPALNKERGETPLLEAAAPEAGNILILSSFSHGLLYSVPVLFLLSLGSGYWISRRALGPVDRMNTAVRSISIGNLAERLQVQATGDELERLGLTFNDMLQRLEGSVKRITQFTADASHELRGPLSFVRTVAEVSRAEPGIDPSSRTSFEEIVAETERATHLLDEMLALARADAEPYQLPQEAVDLALVVEDVRSMAVPIAASRGIELAFALPSVDPPAVQGDAGSLRRLIWILLDNALKYTTVGGTVAVRLSCSPSHSGQHVLVTVADSGVGIPAADLPHIFDRFYRADPSRAVVEGNGLGLAIARWIAETHHATLSVKSTEGEGSTFTLSIPALADAGERRA